MRIKMNNLLNNIRYKIESVCIRHVNARSTFMYTVGIAGIQFIDEALKIHLGQEAGEEDNENE